MTDSAKFLLVGLGNPGSRYEKTRHNAGFMVVDEWVHSQKENFDSDKKCANAKITQEGKIIFCIKPLEYMNLSGKAVANYLGKYKIPMDNVLVVHDEIDIPFEKIKQKVGGGHAGHNGLRDIMEKTGSREFHRLRFGVGRPTIPQMEIADYVLENFSEQERLKLPTLIKQSLTIIDDWLRNHKTK